MKTTFSKHPDGNLVITHEPSRGEVGMGFTVTKKIRHKDEKCSVCDESGHGSMVKKFGSRNINDGCIETWNESW